MKYIIPFFAGFFVGLLALSAATQPPPWRVVRVYDGDTIAVARKDEAPLVLRLDGIDAPEHDQPGGMASKNALEGLLKAGDVHFTPTDVDKYKRTVAVIFAGGMNLNAEQVKTGQAWVYPQYNTDPALPGLEAAARAQRLGIWAQPDPVPPWDWRHKK